MRTIKTYLSLIILVCALQINAQVSVGIKAGVNFADADLTGLIPALTPSTDIFSGYTIGVIAEIPLGAEFSFRPELNYIQKGFSASQSINTEFLGMNIPLGIKANTRLNYIEMPLLLKYRYGNEKAGVYAIAGPGLGYATNGFAQPIITSIIDIKLPQVDIDFSSDTYNRLELSGNIGLGAEIAVGNGKFFTDLRYNKGFTNMLNDPIVDIRAKNQAFNFSAGFAYSF
jgi:hypothetical protein